MATLTAEKQHSARLFSSQDSAIITRRYKAYALLFILLITLLSSFIAWNNNEAQFRSHQKEIHETLENAVHATHAMVKLRISTYQDYLHQISLSSELQHLVKQQLQVKRDRDSLLASPSLQQIRHYFEERKALHNLGFFIIAPDHTNIASRRNSNIGAANLIALQKPALFTRLLQGEATLVPPLRSDVPLPSMSSGTLSAQMQTMFVAKPLFNNSGEILAIVTLRIDPYISLDPITTITELGSAGATLLFTDQGQILSERWLSRQQHDPPVVPVELLQKITPAATETLRYHNDHLVFNNHRQHFSLWHWDPALGIGIAAIQDRDEALAGYVLARNASITYYVAILLLTLTMLGTIIWTQIKADRIQAIALAQLDDIVKQRTRELNNSYIELERSNSNIEKLFQTMPDALLVVNEAGHIIRTNNQAQVLFGYTEAELLELQVETLVPERLRQKHTKLREQLTQQSSTHSVAVPRELYALDKNGSIIPVEIILNKLILEDQPVVTVTLRDISQRKLNEDKRKQLEIQLQQTQKLEAIGQLTGGIAHDFNNLLTSILGYIDLSLRRLSSDDSEKMSVYLHEAQEASYRARDLVKQMLMFSRGDSGHPINIDIGNTITDILKMLRPAIPSSIVIDHVPTKHKLIVHTDPVQLQQVIMNLIINARDAMTEKGHISISYTIDERQARCSSCHETFSGQWIILSMQDNGPGIDNEIMPRIFDPFFTTKATGSGMGLSIIHGIMHSTHGHILLNSDNNGSRFELLFPFLENIRSDNNADEKEPLPTANSNHNQHHIMLIDDEPMLTRLLSDLFDSAGFQCFIFNDPRAALSDYEKYPDKYDLIITDQTMPSLTGYDLATRILAISPQQAIILYSGYAEKLNSEDITALGISAFVEKPFNNDSMLQLAEQALNKSNS